MSQHPIQAIAAVRRRNDAVGMAQVFQIAFDGQITELVHLGKIAAGHDCARFREESLELYSYCLQDRFVTGHGFQPCRDQALKKWALAPATKSAGAEARSI